MRNISSAFKVYTANNRAFVATEDDGLVIAQIFEAGDIDDYVLLEQCMAGVNQPPATSCSMGASSDLADHAIFTMAFSSN